MSNGESEALRVHIEHLREDIKNLTAMVEKALSEGRKDRQQLNARVAVLESRTALLYRLLYGLGGGFATLGVGLVLLWAQRGA